MAKYLKSINLQGFKSFPVKINIDLVDGITGIVGANGSGKSNIVEAVKWVLGEQSAKSLRGDKMEDVIFNGTKERTAMSMAEVSLNFDNDNHWLPIEYNEVSVSRRIFRSGEGHYSINKSRVRLKDVVELFLDTGIGRDSYAIFEQGKIDRLLSESAVERRSLFEDFAGISKFKFRKEEAERKLENSKFNLERINDIIISLEKEVISLKEQAANASKYNELKNSLRGLELKFEALRVKNLENEIMNKFSQKNKAEEKLKPLIEEVKKKEEDILSAEKEIQHREEEFNKIRDDYTKFERVFGEIQTRLENNKERKISIENQLNTLELRLIEGKERQKVLQGELQEKSQDLAVITDEKENIQGIMSGIQSKIDTIYSRIKQMDSNILDHSKELGYVKIITKDEIDKQKHELIAVQTKLENYRVSIQEKWKLQKSIESDLEERKIQYDSYTQNIANLRKELEKILSEIENNLKRENSNKQENTKYNEEIRKLQMKLKSMDKIIMDSLEKQAVLLKDFSIKKPLLESKVEKAMNQLTDCIQNNTPFDETKRIILELKDRFSEYKNYYENILGILYSDEGTYTQKENTQNSIEELTNKIYDNEQELERIRTKIKELQIVRENIQNNYNKNDFELSNIKKEMNKMNGQLTSVLESLKILENQINSASDTIKKKQSLIEELILIVDEYDEEIRELKEKRNNLHDELNKRKIDHARIEEKHKSLLNEINRIKNQISDIERMRGSFETDKNNSIVVIKEMEKRIEDDSKKLEIHMQKIETIGKELESKKKDIEAIQKSRKVMELQRRDIEENIQKLERTIMNLENAISERKGFLGSILENVQNNYSTEIRGIQIQKGENFENISLKINELRQELQNMGDVNLLAIEQYQNAKERLDFLNIQKQDSEKAMADIIILIEETNAKCIEQFSSAFEDIRKAFKKIFARLFDGGRADLILENEKDILNSGINIFAEPPGKKFQSISLLSGGERALVAIAVIFSILYLKPTPFVVLDEMDAPLDDDNIERFKSLLKDFKQTSQFIIVSHSKSTLEICDALYGVTMEEQGVSKVISVAFDEANLLFKSDDNNESPS